MAAPTITILERMNFGSHQAVLFKAVWSSATEDGDAITPGDLGLVTISALLTEQSYTSTSDLVNAIGYDRAAAKIILLRAGADGAGQSGDTWGLVIGK